MLRMLGEQRQRPGLAPWLARRVVRPAGFATATALLVLGTTGGASAQQAPGDTIRLQGVDVSVLRTPVASTSSPLAVGVLTEADLRNGRSGAFLEEALRGLPGVQVQNRYNFAVGEKLVVRGFGGRAQFGVRGVRVVVDGIPATLPDGQGTLDHLDVGSLGRVEVVRGPASALFGNSSGGVVVFESRRPAEVPFRGEAEYVGGSFGLSRIQASASGTVEGTGYFLNVSTLSWDGYRTNTVTSLGRDTYGAADRMGFNGRVTRALAGGEIGLTFNVLDLDSENPGQLVLAQLDDLDRPVHGTGPVNNITRLAGKELEQQQVGLRWAGPLGTIGGDFSLYGLQRSMVNPIVPTIVELDRVGTGVRGQLSGEVETGLGMVSWHSGIEAEFMTDDRVNFVNLGSAGANGPRGNKTVDQQEKVSNIGYFIQLNVPLTMGIQALAGARYDQLQFRAEDHIQRAGNDPTRTGERTMDAFSPSFGVNVPLGADFNLFTNVATVFETPSTTELGNRPDGEGGFNPELNPQTGLSRELGLRGRLGSYASFEVSAYRTDLKDEIVRFQIPQLPGRDFFRNAGTSRHTGAEATLTLATLDGLVRGDLSYSRTNAIFKDFEVLGVQHAGKLVPGISPSRVQAVVRVNPELWFAEIVGTYAGEVAINDANTEGSAAPAYTLLDLRVGARGVVVRGFEFAPWAAVTNVLDEYYVASVIPNAAANRAYDPGPGRALQFGARVTWGGN